MLTFPQAKINIGLNIVSRRNDGYHNLETVFYPIPLRDTLETKLLQHSNAPYLLQTVGTKLDGRDEDNLVVKVYLAMKKEFDLPAMEIYLDKHIPTGAGLGGGSSDAADMMLQLNKTFSIGLTLKDMEQRMASFGADCPFFVKKQPVFAEGIGNVFTPLELSLKGWILLLVKPAVHVSTQQAYALVHSEVPTTCLLDDVKLDVEEWKNVVKNDFEKSVFTAFPEIAAIKQTLYDMGATYASMSGSGSSVFGLFKQEQERPEKVFPDCFIFQEMIRA